MKYSIVIVVLLCTTAYANLPLCVKQDGSWSEWLRWSPCSVTCGTGHQTRHRYCDNPIHKYGGKPCIGESRESKNCTMEDCPRTGVYYEKKGRCSRACGGGIRTISYQCRSPQALGTEKCYKNCPFKQDITEKCNSGKCRHPIQNICTDCYRNALEFGLRHTAFSNFVGHACRVGYGACKDLDFGIRGMYPANNWFFLHCSPDGPWCKPCATRGLVYNAKCGQCEGSRDGPCTGPQNWQKREKDDDILSDEDLW